MHKVSAQLLCKMTICIQEEQTVMPRSTTKQLLAGQSWDRFFLIQGEKYSLVRFHPGSSVSSGSGQKTKIKL